MADCYHRLIYYDRSNGSLNVDSFPSLGGSSGIARSLKMILIYAHNSADDNGGKYQKVNTSANAICKYVTGFSFIAGFASVTRGCHKTPIEKYHY
ncbi:hypothetical protein [Klebsiella quasipneumoniae]|uniref:hypothetical protein n=2 Tax=Klebsiella quasipneumoniae TaxID=1463165 RepID=UPI001C52993D|nr:hypothetical protein [Klebsiella quasipneumoniae]